MSFLIRMIEAANDVLAADITQLVNTTIQPVFNRMESIEAQITLVDEQQDALGVQVSNLQETSNQLASQLQSLGESIATLTTRVDSLAGQVTDFTDRLSDLSTRADGQAAQIISLQEGLAAVPDVSGQITNLSESYETLNGVVQALDERVTGLNPAVVRQPIISGVISYEVTLEAALGGQLRLVPPEPMTVTLPALFTPDDPEEWLQVLFLVHNDTPVRFVPGPGAMLLVSGVGWQVPDYTAVGPLKPVVMQTQGNVWQVLR
mgnify:CR=1 FL=1